MRFERCDYLDGKALLIDRPLVANRYEDVAVRAHSLYHLNGHLLKSSGLYRGHDSFEAPKSMGGPEVLPRSIFDARRRLSDADYFWLGYCSTHFGHFLTVTLSRLWAWKEFGRMNTKLVYVGEQEPNDLFAIPHVGFSLTALGIRPEHLHRARDNDLIPQIRVPDPAFIENDSVAPELLAVMTQIRAFAHPRPEPVKGPIYLTKQKMARGVRSIVNEAEFADSLRRLGVAIVYPEELSLREQIALWTNLEGAATGFAGSAFHGAVFATGKTLCAIAPHYWVSSNQVLLDLVSGNQSVTAQAHGLIEHLPATPEFQDVLRIVDPPQMARLFMEFVEANT